MDFSERVTQFIKRHDLVHSGARLVLGVSGGADSMALLHFFNSKKETWHLTLAVCSVDHMLRGARSAEDLNFVASFCRKWGILFIGKTVDVQARSREKKISLEVAARELRYETFAEAVDSFRADALVLAHHGDDQVETMLMRQVRGTVGPGRAGIPVQRPFHGKRLIRPFLALTKEELSRYCVEHGIDPRQDESNASDAHTRNRFRKYVLPFLKRENPEVHLKFQYESERMTEDEALLRQLAEEKLASVMLSKRNTECTLSIPDFLSIHPALQRRIIHLLLCYLYTNQKLQPMHQPIHIEQSLQLLRSERSSGCIFLPHGLVARKSYNCCQIGFSRKRDIEPRQKIILVPGQTEFLTGIFDTVYVSTESVRGGASVGGDSLIIEEDDAVFPLYVRTWREGDRMRPNGMTGIQKVQRIFINEKIDRMQRMVWPVITDAKGRVLWLPLLKRGVPFPSPPYSEKKNYIKLKFIPFSDFGRTQG
ncbi:tRNA lysidine(34) synthetase TilS [Sporolactobacillus sp. CPB3-1]|uniref:tRNA(Ile)-lysidine synthase n=1 Tax=Sporolactobacillus mangiferae TaxID=2940498 RepID=A0ABT0MDY2_9BACL|nr:tRNA lysidine(34) synthetase TilS [Sporolactobacillus mangiferae]MCL1632479.1 tRNA lysidine(34) synthetase TilS [Sporolactobacillus mangiferae]